MSEEGSVLRSDVIIIGAGFAGIGTAIRLKHAGIQDVVILDAGSEVGGTWRDNTYPGAACDIPSHLYSFSFAPRSGWSRAYAPQDEILDYLIDVADRHGLRDYLYLGRWAVEASFDEPTATWQVRTSTGEVFEAPALVAALGGLREPAYPAIPGHETFAGPSMHTARWDHGVDLAGKRVGVIGTGASAIQVVPGIADEVAHVTLFQRTPPWVLPRFDRAYSGLERLLFRRVPGVRRAHRTQLYWQKEIRALGFGRHGDMIMKPVEALSRAFMRTQIADPDLRRALTPDYRMGCKRVLISDDYYATLARDHIDLVTSGIREITPTGVITDDGETVELDVLVYATGFQVDRALGDLRVRGLDGAELGEVWGDRPSAYLGISVPRFPNLFIMVGPNTALGHNSVVFMVESQLSYVVPAIRQVLRDDVAYVDLRPEALDAFEAEVDRRNADSVWASGCESWYLGKDGVNYTLWPGTTVEYRLRTRRFDVSRYQVARPGRAPLADEDDRELVASPR